MNVVHAIISQCFVQHRVCFVKKTQATFIDFPIDMKIVYLRENLLSTLMCTYIIFLSFVVTFFCVAIKPLLSLLGVTIFTRSAQAITFNTRQHSISEWNLTADFLQLDQFVFNSRHRRSHVCLLNLFAGLIFFREMLIFCVLEK